MNCVESVKDRSDSSMKAIGGYFELECGSSNTFHSSGILLNSGRNALRCIVQSLDIKQIYVPYYTCPVVFNALKAEGCTVIPYTIDENFLPVDDFPREAYIIYNNYFGICGNNVKTLTAKYPGMLVDQAQSFYAVPAGLASFYSPRKFFGLPDGGIVCSSKVLAADYPRDVSYDRCRHLLKRHDLGAEAGYQDFIACGDDVARAPVLGMSNLTEALMGNIDYESARKQRLDNFRYLSEQLGFPYSDLMSQEDVPMCFPYRSSDPQLRKKMIDNRVFVAKYWPGIETLCPHNSWEATLQNELLPLPVDQRYTVTDMKKIVDIITC